VDVGFDPPGLKAWRRIGEIQARVGREQTMAINAAWHEKHRMPKNPTASQRLKWHDAHAKHCACRPFTAAMRAKLERAVAAKPKAPRAAG
jgi:hypothetical protein